MTAQALWLERLEATGNFTRWVGEEVRSFVRGRVLVPASPALYGALDSAIGHHRRYSRGSLVEAARRAALVLAECRPFNLAAAPGWWLNGRVLRRSHPPQHQLRLYDRLVPAFRLVDRLPGPPFGTSLIAAAHRADAGLNVGADL